jgi:MATE family multidrug resistance protein
MIMKNIKKYYPNLKFMIILCAPIIFMRFLESLNEFIATMMVSGLAEIDLASMALVMRFYTVLVVLAWGTLSIVSTMVARYKGEENPQAIADLFIQSIFLLILVSIPLSLIILNGHHILIFLKQDQAIVENCIPFLKAMSLVVFPGLFYFTLIQFVLGLGHTRYAFINTLVFVGASAFFNYSFVFGHFFFPKLGLAGTGYGMATSYLTASGIIILLLIKKCGAYNIFKGDWRRLTYMVNIVKIGTPLGILSIIEMLFLFWITLTIGRLGDVTALAAYQITLQWFEVSLHCLYGITQGISICVSLNIGRAKLDQASQFSYIGLALGITIMLISGSLYLMFPHIFTNIFVKSTDQKNLILINTILSLLPFIAIYQVAESIRLPALTTLRGLQDTRYALYGVAVGYMGISLPLVYFLSLYFSNKIEFMWLSIILGSLSSGMLLHYRAYRKFHPRLS